MDNGYICARNLVYCDVASVISFMCRISEEEQVPAVECWLHRTAVDDSYSQYRAFLQTVEGGQLEDKVTRTYLSTTTIGDSVFVNNPSPFHIISPEAITDEKLSSCNSN